MTSPSFTRSRLAWQTSFLSSFSILNHEIHKIRERGESQNDALVLNFGIVTEVDEDAWFVACRTKLVVNLCAVVINQSGDGLYFEGDFPEADEIGNVSLLKFAPLIFQNEWILGIKKNVLKSQLQLQTFLVNGFEESATFLPIDLKAGSHDPVALVAIN